jgi:hypothetical protein
MIRNCLGKAEVGSSILPGGTIGPKSYKGFGADLIPTPQVLKPERPVNSPPIPGDYPGACSIGVLAIRLLSALGLRGLKPFRPLGFGHLLQGDHHGLEILGHAGRPSPAQAFGPLLRRHALMVRDEPWETTEPL